MEQEPTKRWTVNAFDHNRGEFVEAENKLWVNEAEFDPSMLIQQAPAMRITPSKRQRGETDWLDSVACIGDIHFPFQSDRRLELAQIAMRETQPTQIHLMGDNLDNPNYSRFETRQEWADSSQLGIDLLAGFLGKLRSDHPDARIVWHEGNHDQRMEKRVREFNEDLLQIRRAGETLGAMSLENLVRLEDVDVELSKGYPSALESIRDQLDLYHGSVTTSNGLAAQKVIQSAFRSFTTGHTHQLGIVSKTFHVGREEHTIYGAEAGTYADPDKTPSGKYAPNTTSRHNWQSGVINWLVDDEMAVPEIFPIDDSGVTVRGKYYRS